MRLPAQYRGRTGCADRSPQRVSNRRSFSLFRRDAEHFFGGTKRRDGQRKGVLRDSGNIWKMAFADLLLPARNVELNELHLVRIIEPRNWRIVESKVAIFANTQATEVDRLRLEKFGIPAAFIQRERSVAL